VLKKLKKYATKKNKKLTHNGYIVANCTYTSLSHLHFCRNFSKKTAQIPKKQTPKLAFFANLGVIVL
jgi:hypothetical protein